jgi:hypothetical protein
MERVAQKNVEKKDRTRFNNAWFATTIKVDDERFHNNFKARLRAHPLGYKGFGLGVTSQQQITTRKQRKRKNETCWTSPNQVITFHSVMKGKGLKWVLMVGVKEKKIQGLW